MPSRWSEVGKGCEAGGRVYSTKCPPPQHAPPGSPPQPPTALTCLLALAKASPTPSWVGPLYPGGQASQRKPGLVLMQRTWGKQGWALHWGKKGPGGSEDGRIAGPPRERLLRAYWACTCKVQGPSASSWGAGSAMWGRGHCPKGHTRLCLDVGRGKTRRGTERA